MDPSIVITTATPCSNLAFADAYPSSDDDEVETVLQVPSPVRPIYPTQNVSSNPTGWKKLLWLKQPYDDNYTDKSFLSQLKRNSTVIKYSYKKLVSDFSLIVLHLSLVMSEILVFYGTYRLNWNPLKPAFFSTLATFVGFIYYVVNLKIRRNKELIELQKVKIKLLTNSVDINIGESDLEIMLTEPKPPIFYEVFKSSILIILYLLMLSPVLKSLTNSTSSDSIWALSSWLCFLSVMFNDYQIEFPKLTKSNKELHWKKLLLYNSSLNNSNCLMISSSNNSSSSSLVSLNDQQPSNYSNPYHHPITEFNINPLKKSNLSKNIAVSNAIVLASRLESNASAFSFILFCIEVNGLFPIFNNFTRQCENFEFHLIQLLFIVISVSSIIWYLFGLIWCLLWIVLHLIIVFIGPLYFLTLQKYKEELQGPWDPANPVLKSL